MKSLPEVPRNLHYEVTTWCLSYSHDALFLQSWTSPPKWLLVCKWCKVFIIILNYSQSWMVHAILVPTLDASMSSKPMADFIWCGEPPIQQHGAAARSRVSLSLAFHTKNSRIDGEIMMIHGWISEFWRMLKSWKDGDYPLIVMIWLNPSRVGCIVVKLMTNPWDLMQFDCLFDSLGFQISWDTPNCWCRHVNNSVNIRKNNTLRRYWVC